MTMPFALVDPDDPKYRGRTWGDIEVELNLRDAVQSAIAGYDVEAPEESGPDFAHPSRPLYASFPWEERVESFTKPASCTLKNWRHDCLKYVITGQCATLTFAKGATNNTLDPAMLDALQDAILDLQGQFGVRVVVIKSEGKLFSNGFDPKYIVSESSKSEDQVAEVQLQFARILYFLSRLPQYVVALVQGSAVGAAIGLVAACDHVVAVKGAFFAMNEGKLGMAPTVSIPFIMGRVRHAAHARQLVLAAVSASAVQAKEWGLVNEVVDGVEGLQAECQRMCAAMTLCAPSAVAATKEVILNTSGQAPSSFMLNYVASVLAGVRKSSEAKLGVEAIQAKKKPSWAEQAIVAPA